MTELQNDPRIDPRIKKMFGDFMQPPAGDIGSREELLAAMETVEAKEAFAFEAALFRNRHGGGSTFARHRFETRRFMSQPDGNTVQIQFIRPEGDAILPCVYYMHGGEMAYLSAYDEQYKAWGRVMAAQGVMVAMVDFAIAYSIPQRWKSPPTPLA